MTSSGTLELANEFQTFQRQVETENVCEIQRQYSFHKYLSKRSDYDEWLKSSLEAGYKAQKKDFFICGEYFAYIINFEPQYDQHFASLVKKYIQTAVNQYFNFQEAKILFVKLSQGEEAYLLNEVKRKIQEFTLVTCIQEIQIFINILNKKIKWELAKNQIVRKSSNYSFQRFIDQLIAFLCDKSYAKNEEILIHMIQLFMLVFKYLGKEMTAYKAMINDVMEGYLNRNIFKNEIKVELFRVLALWIQSFGYQNSSLIYGFLNTHISFIQNIHYLKFFLAFLDKMDPSHVNQKQLTKLVKIMINCVFSLPNNQQNIQSYELKSLTIDIIVKISTLFTCDLSKHLSQYFKQASNESHKSLMTSLMYIFDRSLSVQTMKTIEQHKLKYLQSAKPNQYLCHSVLSQYCQQQLQFEQFIINPEMMDDFLWEFLMIRTTVSINYNSICEINKVDNLVVNLVKFIILDIYSSECLEIIEKIVSNNQIYALNFLKALPFPQIIDETKPILLKSIMNEDSQTHLIEMLQNIGKVIGAITKAYQIDDGLRLQLAESILQLSNQLPDRFITKPLIKYQTELLLAITPPSFHLIPQPEFKIFVEGLLLFMRKYESVLSFELYLQIMRRGIYEQHIHNVLMVSCEQIQQLMSGSKLTMMQNLQDIYKINYFILTRSQFNEDVMTNCWKILQANNTLQYRQLCFYIIDLFHYFSIYFHSTNDQSMYIRFQLQNIEKVLSHIDHSIHSMIRLQTIQQLLCCKQALLSYLQELLQRYWQVASSLCEQVQKTHRYLLKAYDCMKDTKFYLSCFREENSAIKKYWCNIQALILLMIPSIITRERNRSVQFLVGKLLQVDERFEWLKNAYPPSDKDQIEEFVICFNCQINELRLMTDKMISSQT